MSGILQVSWDGAEQIVNEHPVFWDEFALLIVDCAVHRIKLWSDRARLRVVILVRQLHKIKGLFIHCFLVVCVQVHPLCQKTSRPCWWFPTMWAIIAAKVQCHTHNQFVTV